MTLKWRLGLPEPGFGKVAQGGALWNAEGWPEKVLVGEREGGRQNPIAC